MPATRPVVQRLSPAATAIERFGGVRELARELKLAPSTVSRWAQDWPGGTGGVVPNRHHQRILSIAAKRGVTLTGHELRFGAVIGAVK